MEAHRFLVVIALASPACSRDTPPAPARTAPTATAPAPQHMEMTAPAPSAPPPAAAGDSVAGTVIETMNSGGYTYAKLDQGATQVWVAGPETKLAVGTQIASVQGMVMSDFRSTTLNRTFDRIYFVSSFPVAGGPHAASAPAPSPAPAPAAPPAVALGDKIEPAPGGQTIASVFAAKDTLAGKPVRVRGKVVKVNDGILGRNWLHLQDGTGAAGTNDLTVTSAMTAKLGDVVTARGTVARHKDFGAGYSYDVLVEDAELAPK